MPSSSSESEDMEELQPKVLGRSPVDPLPKGGDGDATQPTQDSHNSGFAAAAGERPLLQPRVPGASQSFPRPGVPGHMQQTAFRIRICSEMQPTPQPQNSGLATAADEKPMAGTSTMNLQASARPRQTARKPTGHPQTSAFAHRKQTARKPTGHSQTSAFVGRKQTAAKSTGHPQTSAFAGRKQTAWKPTGHSQTSAFAHRKQTAWKPTGHSQTSAFAHRKQTARKPTGHSQTSAFAHRTRTVDDSSDEDSSSDYEPE